MKLKRAKAALDLLNTDDMPPDGDLRRFYDNQIGVRGFIPNDHEDTDDSDYAPLSDSSTDDEH